MRASVAEAAVAAGADIINDVSGALADPAMRDVAAASDATFVAMHWRGHSVDMQQQHTAYDDIVTDVCRELAESVAALREAGADVVAVAVVVDRDTGAAQRVEAEGLATHAYAAALLSINRRGRVNRAFLDYLAARLGLAAEIARSLERRYRA